MSFIETITGIQKNTFGLDIGYQSIKAIQLKKSGNYFKLIAGGTLPSPPNPFANGRILQQKELATVIKKAKKDFRISANAAISALPESTVFTKIIRVPKMTLEEMENTVPLEVASFIPFEPSQTYIDFQITNQYDNSYEVLVIAAPKTLVDDLVATCNLAGIELLCLETKPIANSRALIKPGSQETIMILDIGARSSSMTVCEDVVIKFTATLSLGGKNLQEVILDITNSPSKTKSQETKKAVTSILDNIADKVLDGIKYYQGHKGNKTISKILVVGGGAKMPGLTRYLTDKIKIKTELGNPWQMILNPPQDTSILQATTAIGLAMRQI